MKNRGAERYDDYGHPRPIDPVRLRRPLGKFLRILTLCAALAFVLAVLVRCETVECNKRTQWCPADPRAEVPAPDKFFVGPSSTPKRFK
jgi:hypothetical protein